MAEKTAICSIIIPLLNDAEAVKPLLESLQPVREQGHEIIVADGGSKDLDNLPLQKLVDQVVVSAAGRARQMNQAATLAKGDVLWFVHADSDVDAEHAVKLVTSILQKDYGWGRFDVRLSGRDFRLRIIAGMMNRRSRLTSVATGDQAIFVRQELFDAVNGFPEIALMEDIAMSKKLRRRAACLCVREPLVTTSSRRWRNHGVIRTVLLMWGLRIAYFAGVSPDKLAGWYKPCNFPIRAS